MAITDYLERALASVTMGVRGHDAGAFTRQPVFKDIPPTITVTSPINKDAMPVEYTQIGNDWFPPLAWTNPEGTQQVILVVQDVDVPFPFPVTHGFYYGIPPAVQSIDTEDFADVNPKYASKGIKVTRNLRGRLYSSPRPLLNHGPHRYFYQVVALRRSIEGLKEKNEPLKSVLAKLKREDILAWGEWVGVAERKTS